ncbi:MAG: glycoside hydrolase family 2, partial [Sulfurovum sp.]
FPHLYTLKLQLANTQIHQEIGFKSLTQNQKKIYLLNGTPLYLKGTNYISSQYMSEMDEKAFKKDLELMKDAHINTIRVHAHIEPKRFYALCDKMGFLVWQDYNLQWGYIQSEAFQKEATKQAKEMVDMLYNHPSIYVWSMHNEPPWNSEWMKWKYPDYNTSINKKLDDALYTAIQAYDTHHIIKKLSSNLEHPWFGWYSGKYQDFAKPSKVATISEYGAQAIPRLSSLKKFMPQKYLVPKSKKAKKMWEYHNYQFDWSEKNGVKFKQTTQQLIDDSQTYQAKLIKYATEMLRIQKYTKTTAIFQFMFNEGWPSMNWGIVDYYRHEKAGYHALKKAFAPIIVVAKQTPNNVLEFYVVNDKLEPIKNASLKITVSIPNEKLGYLYFVTMPKDSTQKIAQISLKHESTIDMQLRIGNNIISNHYTFTPYDTKKKANR